MAKTTTHADYTATALTLTTAAQPNITSLGTLTALTVDNIGIDGSTISNSSGDITLDASGDIILDADGDDIKIAEGGTVVMEIKHESSSIDFSLNTGNEDFKFKGSDDGSTITALQLDISEAGKALFNAGATFGSVASGSSTATPIELNLGSTFADAAGSNAKTKLKVFEDSSANVYGFGVSSGLFEYHVPASAAHAFYVNDSEKVRIDSSGKVGIGNTPVRTLQVHTAGSNASYISVTNGNTGATAGDGIVVGVASDSTAYLWNYETADTAFATQNTERLRIRSDGKVSIGSTSGAELFNVYAGSGGTAAVEFAGNGNTLGTTSLFVGQGGGGDGYVYQRANLPLIFATNNTERARIDAAGRYAIGVTNPDSYYATNLVVSGASEGGITIASTATNISNYIMFADGTSGDARYRGYFAYSHANDRLSFAAGGSERMHINSNGRIGIGVTGGNAGLHVGNGDIRCTSAAVANDANSISMSQESTGGFIVARGPSTSERGRISLTVSRSNGGGGLEGLVVANDGSVSKYSGSFKIDHPLESKKDTHHLVHSFVEGPQADNMYRGVVALENGTATINLDTVSGMTEGTFVALNTDIQCFTSNETDWDSVKGSISGNTLTISCQNTSSTATVSWLVIGERQDQHMLDADWTDENGKVIVEPLKTETGHTKDIS